MWKHKNFINLQLCAGPIPTITTLNIYVNGIATSIAVGSESSSAGTWTGEQEFNTWPYTINGNTVVWSDGTILQYNGVDVLPTDTIVENRQYTTRAATPTLTFKHFYDAGTIGSGAIKFRHYSQTEPSTGETWVLNYPTDSAGIIKASVQFTSNGRTYSLLEAQKSSGGRAWYKIYYDTTEVYSFMAGSGDYTDEAYRTITFSTPPTGDLLTWLQANGTKQGGATLIDFTINGTAYQAEEGMTWEQWVNSSYNTYGCTIEGSSVKGKGNNGSPTYIYINQNSSLTLVSSTDSIIKNATYEDAAGGAGN